MLRCVRGQRFSLFEMKFEARQGCESDTRGDPAGVSQPNETKSLDDLDQGSDRVRGRRIKAFLMFFLKVWH
jgi:hypothetical protein